MNLNNFETKLNTDDFIKDDVRKLLNYAFELKASIKDREERLEKVNYEPYKNYGKREMLYNIQRQLNTMNNNDNTMNTVKKIIIKLEKILQIEEETQGIETELDIEEDIVNVSKKIINNWVKEIK